MSVVEDLRKVVPGMHVSDAASDRVVYSRDLWPRDLIRLRAHDVQREGPSAVVWPESDDEVVRILAYARETGAPLVPFGAGSGVCGGVAPSSRAIVVDLKRMAEFRPLPEQGIVQVGAGVLGINLEQELGALGYTVGHFPSSILCSTVGGWLAARGAGQCSGRYGKIEDMVVGVDAVLGSGHALKMRWRSTGANLAPLFIGSEGTLGVITRVQLRMHELARARAFSSFSFRTVEQGWEALREVYQSGLRPAVARLYDALDTALHSSHSGSKKPGELPSVLRTALRLPRAVNRAVLALEGKLLNRCQMVLIFEGSETATAEDAELARGICGRHAGSYLGEAPARAWLEHRYSVSYRQSPVFRAGAFSDTMEVAAPWSKLRTVYDEVRRALGKHVVVLAHLSHAYPDGCSIYFTFSAVAEDDQRALALYDTLWPEALEAALRAGATLSHHHGVGRSKAPLMGAELGFGVELMRRLKRAWDPDGLMNPGALIPKDEARATSVQLESPRVPLVLDRSSELADLSADLTLDEADNLLARQGYTLGVLVGGVETLAHWIARGMPGVRSRWEDPVEQTLVALSARVRGGEFCLTPVPRRAVGPDLSALFVGESRVGEVTRVTLHVHPLGGRRSRALPGAIASADVMNQGERSAWERMVAAQLG